MNTNWQEKRAESLEAETAAIDGLLLWIERCEGLFRGDSEMDLHVRAVRNIATVEVQNREREIKKLRAEA